MKCLFFCITIFFSLFGLSADELIYRIGKGTLEENGRKIILKLEGKPYERGVQHGTLLKEKVQQNIKKLINSDEFNQSSFIKTFHRQMSTFLNHIPSRYLEEMRGIAYGADVPFEKVLLFNLFPGAFHCMGLTVQSEVMLDHALYHVCVLDHQIAHDIQSDVILVAMKPEEKHAFISVGYAGYIGSIAGMNEKKISIGEIDEGREEHLDDLPMAFRVREVLENASSLEEAKTLLENVSYIDDHCYILSDGNQERGIGIYAMPSQFYCIEPGLSYAFFSPHTFLKNCENSGVDDKFFIGGFSPLHSEFQSRIHSHDGTLMALFNHQPKDCILLSGFGHLEWHSIIAKRIHDLSGKLNVEHLQEIVQCSATNETHLQNVIFRPSTLDLWISYSAEDKVLIPMN